MKKILIIGATGFVGSHCLEALVKFENYETIAGCRNPTALLKSFNGEVRQADLRYPQQIEKLLENIDVVIHAAAWSSLWGNETDSEELYLRPSMNLINAAIKMKIKRFIFVSSLSVAAPKNSQDAMSHGIMRPYWPHEKNVVRIENKLRASANEFFNVVNMRFGIFAGARYGLGLLPILAPRLKTHLVPWVEGGRTSMPIVDGRDIGQALALAAIASELVNYESFNIVGPEVPKVRDVLLHLNRKHELPLPHFSVPFPAAFAFAWLMEKLDQIVPFEPLVTRSIIHLMEETNTNNQKASSLLGYEPNYHWREAIDLQMAEMALNQMRPMKMAKVK